MILMKEQKQKSEELKEVMRKTLSPRHHAMLYAYIVRSCRKLPYGDVEQVIEKMTVEYGKRRGRRMAKRATKDNMPLTALNLSLIHISEPTRHAEISYAVFCLKKKKIQP